MKSQTKTLYLIAALMLMSQILIYPSLSNPHKFAQAQPILTIQTDKPSYQQGEVVKIFGTVKDSSSDPIGNATISIEIKNPHNNTIFLDIVFSSPNGTYEDSFRLHNDTALGKYHVYATASALGYPPTMNQTTFIVGAIGNHDVAATNVKLFKTVVGKGHSMSVNVTFENQGSYTESFNVTVFYNETAITLPNGKNHTTTTLTSGNSTTLTFTWNTTGVAKGNYTISAYITPVPDEIDITDNTRLADEEVCVSIPGDLDADFDVDLYDAVKLLVRYGVKKDNPKYDPNCDIDGDGDIDLYDAVILLTHYGQKDP